MCNSNSECEDSVEKPYCVTFVDEYMRRYKQSICVSAKSALVNIKKHLCHAVNK